uniref:Uncharacterized protein n=1 Tax=Cucumis melo TaxID=3656 RepID=A0A9I9E923_CUCME
MIYFLIPSQSTFSLHEIAQNKFGISGLLIDFADFHWENALKRFLVGCPLRKRARAFKLKVQNDGHIWIDV